MSSGKLFLFLTAFIILLQENSSSVNPGLSISVREQTMKIFEDHVMPVIINKLNTEKLNDIHFKKHIDFIGPVEISYKNLKPNVSKLDSSQISVVFEDNNKVKVAVNSINATVSYDYEYKTNFYNGKGKSKFYIKNLGMDMTNKIFALANTHDSSKLGPGINIDSLIVTHLQLDLDIKEDTPIARLLKFILGIINDLLKKSVKNSLIEKIVPSANSYLNKTMASVSLSYQIPKTKLLVDYSLLEQPKISNKLAQSVFNATVYAPNLVVPKKSYPLPEHTKEAKNIEAFISQSIFDSLLFSMQNTNTLNFAIKSSSFPKNSSIKLNTKTFGLIIPGLSKKYGDDKNMDIYCKSTKVPSFNLDSDKSTLEFKGDCDFDVELNATTKETAFVGIVDVNAEVKIYLDKGYLKGEIKSANLNDFSTKDSKVGEIDATKVKNLVNLAMNWVLPALNKKIFSNTGIKLPTVEGLSFEKTEIQVQKNYIKFEMDPVFKSADDKETEYVRFLG